MRVLYFSGPSFFDLDLSFVKRLAKKVDCYYFLDLYPKLRQATAMDIDTPIRTSGILPIDSFHELRRYSRYLDFAKTFVINRVSDRPLAPSNLMLQWKLFRRVTELHPDVVHFNNHIYFNHFYLFLCAGKKLITIHDPFPHSGDEQWFSSLIPRATRFINNKYVRNHLLLNKAMVDGYRQASQLDRTNIISSTLGVYEYLSLFSGVHPDNACGILFFGRMAPYKGLDVLLSAFQQILTVMPDTVLTIAGAGDLGLDIRAYALPSNQLKIVNRYVPNGELAELIRGTKLVVCPYKDATQSGVIMTAFAFAKPVVATNVGALAEMVEDGVTGRLVPPNDPKSLADAIVALLRDDAKRMEMQDGIRNVYWHGARSWDKSVDGLVTAYGDLN